MKRVCHAKQAFSLVELSIVLVILGLLTGGILTGQNLIRAAELRAITTELNTFQTAAHTFRDKYFGLPGDITNATDFWGAMTNCGVASPSGTGTQTCNGDGDGILEVASGASRTGERFGFWQQLANAGMIEGSYTGIAGSVDAYHVTAGNSPASKLSSGYWSVYNPQTTYSSNAAFFDGTYNKTILQFGGLSTAGTAVGALLKPEEVWNIDTKIDDGKPAYGTVRERRWDDCTDAASSADLAASYALDNDTVACTPIFFPGF